MKVLKWSRLWRDPGHHTARSFNVPCDGHQRHDGKTIGVAVVHGVEGLSSLYAAGCVRREDSGGMYDLLFGYRSELGDFLGGVCVVYVFLNLGVCFVVGGGGGSSQ